MGYKVGHHFASKKFQSPHYRGRPLGQALDQVFEPPINVVSIPSLSGQAARQAVFRHLGFVEVSCFNPLTIGAGRSAEYALGNVRQHAIEVSIPSLSGQAARPN